MIYIVKPCGDVLGALNSIKEETCSLKCSLTDMWELSFEITKYIDDNNFEPSDYYDSVAEKMRIRLETDLVDTMFVIDSEPVISNNGIQEIKKVTAHTIECELQNRILRLFYINNGNQTSKEYLANNNINQYTQLPKEYISLVNFDNHELSLLHLVLENTEWTIDEKLKDTEQEMCAKKFSFSVDEIDIYSFLMNEVAKVAQIIFFFDRKNRIISFKSYDNIGEDTGIFIGLRNLANQIDIESTSDTGLITKYKPTCSESLGIEYVNFGDPYLYNMDYFANTHNEYGDFKFVTESFHNEYSQWIKKRGEKRKTFINLTKEYNQNLIKIDELKNKLPNDGCNIDYKTYKADELYLSLNAYENAVATLLTLYKEDYKNIYTNPTVPLNEDHLKTTMYWDDYYSYRYQIIPSVLEAMKIWYKTDSYGNLMVGDDGKYIVCENGNPAYANNVDIVKPIDSFKYEFELYGLDELQSKKKAWMECVNLLYKDGFIKSGTVNDPTEYSTPDETGWNGLSAQQKLQFTTFNAFKENLNNFLDYMSFNVRPNSITGTSCKGIIRQCEDAITERQNEINTLQSVNDVIQKDRNALSSSVLPENNFSVDNLKIFRLLLHEDNYTNANIVTTSLDDIASTIDVAEELYQDTVNQLSIVSQPQYSFKTTIDNLFALEEFSSFRNKFEIGNFIKLLPDLFSDAFVKLRIISIETNPLIETNDFSVEFSTMTKSLSDISDLAFLFGSNNGASGPSGGNNGSSGGTYGKNDAEIQIANNMLNALLKTETFGTQVSDIILDSVKTNRANFGKLIAHSGIFDTLETGQIKVSGDSLFDRIKSINWNGSENNLLDNTIGSIIDLYNGHFSFAGGKLKWDGKSLIVEGTLNGCDGNFRGSINVNDNFAVDDKGNVTAYGSLTATDAYIKGNIEATNSVISESVFIDGDIEADTLNVKTTGNIAGWTFDENGFYKNNNTIGQESGAYIGNDGISVGDDFVVNANGKCLFNNVNSLKCAGKVITADKFGATIRSFNISDPVYSNFINFEQGIALNENLNYSATIDISLTNVVWESEFIIVIYNTSSNDVIQLSGKADTSNFNLHSSTLDTDSIQCIYDTNNNKLLIKIPQLSLYSYINEYKIEKIESMTYINQMDSFSDELSKNFFYNNQIRYVRINNIIYENSILYYSKGIQINTKDKQITGDSFRLTPGSLNGDKNFVIRLGDNNYPNVFINRYEFIHNGLSTSSSGNNLVSTSDGKFRVKSSSSKRYKHDIQQLVTIHSSNNLNPHNLYDIDVVSFKYNT